MLGGEMLRPRPPSPASAGHRGPSRGLCAVRGGTPPAQCGPSDTGAQTCAPWARRPASPRWDRGVRSERASLQSFLRCHRVLLGWGGSCGLIRFSSKQVAPSGGSRGLRGADGEGRTKAAVSPCACHRLCQPFSTE